MDTNAGSECLKQGTVLNQKYEIRKTIGTGGFAYTYLCTDLVLNMPVAVKQYRGNRENSEQGNKWFLNEARTMAKFAGNPGIVYVRDFFEENKRAFIVMEYLDGVTMKEFLQKEGTLTPQQTFSYLKPVMEVLDSIHRAGVIHRDISPDNIMMLEDNTVKLLDFGAAKDTGREGETLPVMYKKGYTPEEQFKSSDLQGPWTDVYAICATIYKCITGKTPAVSLERAYSDTVIVPSGLDIDIPKQFEKVLMKGMAVHKEDRYQSMKELMEDMEESLMEEEQTEAEEDCCTVQGEETEEELPEERPETDVRQTGSRQKKQKKAGFLLFLLLILVAAGTLGGLYVKKNHSNPYEYDMMTSKVEHKNVTPEMIRQIQRSEASRKLYFQSCTLDQEAISALGEVENLQKLYLYDCTGYTSLEPLEQLPGLVRLEITGKEGEYRECSGQIFKGAVFKNLTNLKIKNMNFTEGLSFLKKFTELTILNLSDNMGIDKLDFLQDMEDLEVLNLSGSKVETKDWSMLRFCPYLKEFNGSETGFLPGTEPLQNPKLEKLSLRGNEIRSIRFLSGCPELTELDLGNNQIRDLTPLSGCRSLYKLNLEKNNISDLTPLSGQVAELEILDLSDNEIRSLMALSGSSKLKELDVSKNKLKFLKGLEKKPELTKILASDNMLRNLEAVRTSANLTYMDFRNNQLQNITALSGLESDVEALLLDHNRIKDISMLPEDITYKKLSYQENPVAEKGKTM